MSDDERDSFLDAQRTVRVATVDAGGRPHVTPLWFIWSGGSLWFYSLTRSSRWAHLTQDPEVAAVIDAGDSYGELRGVELRGRARIVGGAPRGDEHHDILDAIESAYAAKYRPGRPFEADGRHAWVALDPRELVSWDFRKLAPRTS